VLVVLALVITALICMMWVLARGPSPTAQRLFVMTVQETSAMGFLANIYLSSEEIELIMNSGNLEYEFVEPTDTSLITLPSIRLPAPVRTLEHSGDEDVPFVEEEYADIELHEITGNGYRGYMMIVRDPTRLFVGTPSTYGGRGLTLMQLVANRGAVGREAIR
jgi:exopolysaccharide biosynthesis protein